MNKAKLPRLSLVDSAVAELRSAVARGEWPVGERIPTEPRLSEQFGVGRNTVREAVRVLVHAGLLETRQGDGTYVRARLDQPKHYGGWSAAPCAISWKCGWRWKQRPPGWRPSAVMVRIWTPCIPRWRLVARRGRTCPCAFSMTVIFIRP